MLKKHRFALLGMSGVLVLAATAAFASGHIEEDIHAIAKASVTLSQAIDIAEKSTPGSRAIHAAFERDHLGHWMFAVEVAKAGEAQDIVIDSTSGKVLSVSHDRKDHGSERD